MENKVLFHGILPAMITPVDENGKLKEKVLRDLLRWEIAQGVNGFYLCGSTGEGFLTSPDVRKQMLEITLDETRGKGLSVITHTGAIDLKTTLDLTRHAHEAGADAVSSVPPIYFIYGENEIVDYYRAMADAACGTPLLMYGYGAAKLSFELVEKILEIENVIGIKWTFPDYYTMLRIKALNGGNVNVINGPDESLICGLAAGADAGIGTTYNVMPKLFCDLYREFKAGNVAAATALQQKISAVITVMIRYHAIAATKAMLTEMGFDVGQCQKPLRQISADERKALMREVSGIIDFREQKIL